MSEILEAEVGKPDAVRELELFCELRKLKTFLEPIAKNGRGHIGKSGGYDYFHIDDILETIDTVINEHGLLQYGRKLNMKWYPRLRSTTLKPCLYIQRMDIST